MPASAICVNTAQKTRSNRGGCKALVWAFLLTADLTHSRKHNESDARAGQLLSIAV